jgi:hypothetical protein
MMVHRSRWRATLPEGIAPASPSLSKAKGQCLSPRALNPLVRLWANTCYDLRRSIAVEV